jgi:hypothetical protein
VEALKALEDHPSLSIFHLCLPSSYGDEEAICLSTLAVAPFLLFEFNSPVMSEKAICAFVMLWKTSARLKRLTVRMESMATNVFGLCFLKTLSSPPTNALFVLHAHTDMRLHLSPFEIVKLEESNVLLTYAFWKHAGEDFPSQTSSLHSSRDDGYQSPGW